MSEIVHSSAGDAFTSKQANRILAAVAELQDAFLSAGMDKPSTILVRTAYDMYRLEEFLKYMKKEDCVFRKSRKSAHYDILMILGTKFTWKSLQIGAMRLFRA